MQRERIAINSERGRQASVPAVWVHTLVIGSGAAGLNAAVQLFRSGIDDLLIVTEGLAQGTSINTGSDKQTYYKLSLCGADADAPALLAETYVAGGGMHGDLALAEASLSARAFLNLVNLGVPFPRDAYGQFIGYKTDHDPRQRATSIGPYTSREMCRALIREVERLGIPVREGRVAVRLLTVEEARGPRAAGAVLTTPRGGLEVVLAENVVFAVGGPGGLYRASVYPEVHTGAIGLALLAGAKAQGLPESQYGLASLRPRWNVSGTYMQVVPRFVSTGPDGKRDPREFLQEYFDSPGALHSLVFLKGYQWPFDARKALGGSSLVDILVYIETVKRGRRVFLDYRKNPEGFRVEALAPEALEYLTRSRALLGTPIARLRQMNPGAVEFYRSRRVDLARQPLEIAVSAQHNNGGLAANHWWESLNLRHLFPVGEVNGSHGLTRPGGSALNAGQVGGFRAAEFIAARYRGASLPRRAARAAARAAVEELGAWARRAAAARRTWQAERAELQRRMSRAGAHIRAEAEVRSAVQEAWDQFRRLEAEGCRGDRVEAWRTRQLCFAHVAYLEAIRFAGEAGVGSRGSAVVLSPGGAKVHDGLEEDWRIQEEEPSFRDRVQETIVRPDGTVEQQWVVRRPIPTPDHWFETAWARFRSGEIYGD
jgi:succinate dehydrogenase/fumarate reductase flavoprotein subunit